MRQLPQLINENWLFKNLLTEFEKDVGFNIDLKKRIGLILRKEKFIIKQTLWKN